MRIYSSRILVPLLFLMTPLAAAADEPNGPWITIRLENATEETQVDLPDYTAKWWSGSYTTKLQPSDCLCDKTNGAIFVRVRALDLSGADPRLTFTIRQPDGVQTFVLDLNASARLLIQLPKRTPQLPSADDLAKLGVDPTLAPYASVAGDQLRVPGYHAVPFEIVDRRIVPKLPRGRFEPIMLNVKAEVAGLGRALEVQKVSATAGPHKLITSSKGRSISLAAILVAALGQSLEPSARAEPPRPRRRSFAHAGARPEPRAVLPGKSGAREWSVAQRCLREARRAHRQGHGNVVAC